MKIVYQSVNYKKAYLWVLPAFLAMLLIQFIPGIIGTIVSFFGLSRNYLTRPVEAPFVFIKNYSDIFSPGNPLGASYVSALASTMIFTLFTTIIGYLLGLVAALVVNYPFKGRAIVRAILMLPWVVPSIVSYQVWRVLLLQEWGIINQILTKLGLMHEKVTWLSSLAMFSLILVRIWTVFPFVMITLLAGLQTINPEEYEAAQIDGANAIQRFRYITLPGISIVSKIMLLLLFIWGTGEFNAPYILFDKSPPQSAMLLSVHIYKYSFDMWDFAHGTAMSTVMLIIMFSFASIYAKLMVKDVN